MVFIIVLFINIFVQAQKLKKFMLRYINAQIMWRTVFMIMKIENSNNSSIFRSRLMAKDPFFININVIFYP